jgi:hypothetical protein
VNHIPNIHHLTSAPHLYAALRRRATADNPTQLPLLPTAPTAAAAAAAADGPESDAAPASEEDETEPGPVLPPAPMLPGLACGPLLVPELYRLDSTGEALVMCDVAGARSQFSV